MQGKRSRTARAQHDPTPTTVLPGAHAGPTRTADNTNVIVVVVAILNPQRGYIYKW